MEDIHFNRYGIDLTSLQSDEIEMVRQWRNDPKIASLMLDQTYITEAMQQVWFIRMRQSSNQCYMLARFRGEPIGVASLTAIDMQQRSCEPGMYIYPDHYRNNILPFCVAFALNDLAFEQLGMQRLYGKIFDENTASVRFHEASGYIRYDGNEAGLSLYMLEQEPYLAARAKIARFIRY